MLTKLNREYWGGVKPSEITPEAAFLNRRQLVQALGIAAGAAVVGGPSRANVAGEAQYVTSAPGRGPDWLRTKLAGITQSPLSTDEPAAPYANVTTYNNFYEFGTDKGDPAANSGSLVTDPWRVEVAGEAEVTGAFTLEDILAPHSLEERVYRLRCVEAWSMVIPWVGFPLAALLKRFKPSSAAKFVRFETLYAPEQMPGQRSFFSSIDYPYVEGLRLDEAMNELAFMAVGVYGKALPNQNGAPLRLVVPWKYGFKSIKSIVKLEFTREKPLSTWEKAAPHEYGFYANVNPEVSHPRWSQATERRLPAPSLFTQNRIPTTKFNGYAEHVAHLYAGMDLRRLY